MLMLVVWECLMPVNDFARWAGRWEKKTWKSESWNSGCSMIWGACLYFENIDAAD